MTQHWMYLWLINAAIFTSAYVTYYKRVLPYLVYWTILCSSHRSFPYFIVTLHVMLLRIMGILYWNEQGVFAISTKRSPNAGFMLGHRHRRWPNINPTFGQTSGVYWELALMCWYTFYRRIIIMNNEPDVIRGAVLVLCLLPWTGEHGELKVYDSGEFTLEKIRAPHTELYHKACLIIACLCIR